MNPQISSPEDLTQPVAYDADGRPLYHHPPQTGRPAPVVAQTNSYVTARPEIIDGENFDPRLRSQYANDHKSYMLPGILTRSRLLLAMI